MVLLLAADVEAGAGHVFAEAAFGEEAFFRAEELAVEEKVRLMQQADGDVDEDLRRAGISR